MGRGEGGWGPSFFAKLYKTITKEDLFFACEDFRIRLPPFQFASVQASVSHCNMKSKNQKGILMVFNTVPIITDVSVCILDFSSVGHPLSGDPEKKGRYNSNIYNS